MTIAVALVERDAPDDGSVAVVFKKGERTLRDRPARIGFEPCASYMLACGSRQFAQIQCDSHAMRIGRAMVKKMKNRSIHFDRGMGSDGIVFQSQDSAQVAKQQLIGSGRSVGFHAQFNG